MIKKISYIKIQKETEPTQKMINFANEISESVILKDGYVILKDVGLYLKEVDIELFRESIAKIFKVVISNVTITRKQISKTLIDIIELSKKYYED